MTRTFVVPDDPVHNLIREITRRAPLYARFSGPERPPRIVYDVREELLPDDYYSLGMLHSLGGMALESLPQSKWRVRPEERTGITQQVNFFDLVSLDKRCCRDLRLKPKKMGPFMLSAELLVFGTGSLRARNDDSQDPLHRFLWSQHGRLHPKTEVVYANIRALHRYSDHAFSVGKETFDSTNLVYGDVFGELEQLWERRADTSFLNVVCQTLHEFRVRAEIAAYLRPPHNLMGVVELHLKRQALWKTPPADARALLRRIEHVLNRTVIEKRTSTRYQWRQSPASTNLSSREVGGRTTEADDQGYDGWIGSGDRYQDEPGFGETDF